jgi:hypothetical protein
VENTKILNLDKTTPEFLKGKNPRNWNKIVTEKMAKEIYSDASTGGDSADLPRNNSRIMKEVSSAIKRDDKNEEIDLFKKNNLDISKIEDVFSFMEKFKTQRIKPHEIH